MSKNINGGWVKISYFNFVTYLFLNQVAFAKLAGSLIVQVGLAQSENVGTPELRLRMSVY